MFRFVFLMSLLFHLLTPSVASAQTPICGLKRYCGEMRTCAEAYHYFSQCGLRRLDADNDGIPCETICGKTHAVMNERIKEQPFQLPTPTKQEASMGPPSLPSPQAAPKVYTCGTKKTCPEMVSCEEATHYLKASGLRSLDGNGDGIACNGLCPSR
jgi:hypothetical protein